MKNVDFCFLFSSPSLTEAMKQINGISRSQLIKRGLLKKQLNQRISNRQLLSLPIEILNYGLINPCYEGPEIEILQETDSVLALSKPPNIHSHPIHYNESDNLLSFLRSIGRYDLLEVNKKGMDRGLLYRLDYATSGLILAAKREDDYQELRDNYHHLVKKKIYIAKLTKPLKAPVILSNRLKPQGRRGAIMGESPDGIEAKIHVSPLFEEFVTVELGQGIRHQIRAQLSLNGMPIVGDRLYGGVAAERLFLHCYQYQIMDQKFKAPCPFLDHTLSL